MRDPCFLALLRDVVAVRRAQVSVSSRGGPLTPIYRILATDVPCALQPARTVVASTLVGSVSRVTHVGYLEPADLMPGDLLLERVVSSTLIEPAREGDLKIRVENGSMFSRGDQLEIGVDPGSELVVAGDVDGSVVALAAPLVNDHPAGGSVWRSVVYRVLAVGDEGGQGHHLRAELEQVAV